MVKANTLEILKHIFALFPFNDVTLGVVVFIVKQPPLLMNIYLTLITQKCYVLAQSKCASCPYHIALQIHFQICSNV